MWQLTLAPVCRQERLHTGFCHEHIALYFLRNVSIVVVSLVSSEWSSVWNPDAPTNDSPSSTLLSQLQLVTSHSPTTSLSAVAAGRSTVREKAFLAVTKRPLWQQQPSCQASCIAWHNISVAMWQLQGHPSKFPICQEERNLFT